MTTTALVDAGANLQKCDPNGNTMLYHLVSNQCSLSGEEVSAALGIMKPEQDFNARNQDGDTPISKYILFSHEQLRSPCEDPYIDQLKSFQKHGVDYHTINEAGKRVSCTSLQEYPGTRQLKLMEMTVFIMIAGKKVFEHANT